MFTIKMYRDGVTTKIRVLEADSFSILRSDSGAEITLHRKVGDDERYDLGDGNPTLEADGRQYDRAIIENAAGKTTEILGPFLSVVTGLGHPNTGRQGARLNK